MTKIKFSWIDALIIILFVVIIYLILTRIFGQSATDLAITLGLFLFLFVNQYKINREMGEIKMRIRHGFKKVAEDMKALRKIK